MKQVRQCKHQLGEFRPVLDLNRCESHADCVRVCPVPGFAIATSAKDRRASLSLNGKLKASLTDGSRFTRRRRRLRGLPGRCPRPGEPGVKRRSVLALPIAAAMSPASIAASAGTVFQTRVDTELGAFVIEVNGESRR